MKRFRLLVTLFVMLPWVQIAFGVDLSTKKQAESNPTQLVSTPTAQEWKLLNGRLDEINKGITKLTEKSAIGTFGPAILALLGTILGAVIAVIIANRNLKFQETLAKDKARLDSELARQKAWLDIGNSFAQWQLKQLSNLYGPLHALFRQSIGLYRHMNVVLVKRNPTKFRLQQATTGEGFDGQVFEICVNDHWDRFRTVLHINEVYGRGYGIEEYFDEIEVLPVNRANGNLVESESEKENGLEEAVFGRADHRLPATGGGRRAGQRVVPATWIQ